MSFKAKVSSGHSMARQYVGFGEITVSYRGLIDPSAFVIFRMIFYEDDETV